MQEERAQADTEQKTAMTELNHLLRETIRLNLNRGAAGVAGLDAVDDEALDVCAFMCVYMCACIYVYTCVPLYMCIETRDAAPSQGGRN